MASDIRDVHRSASRSSTDPAFLQRMFASAFPAIRAVLLLFLALPSLAACADPPADPAQKVGYAETNDPAEPANRVIFDGNQILDRNAIKPVAKAYRDDVPEGVQHGLHNLLSNLRQPLIEMNDVLQANPARAWVTAQRFAINTTFGVLGLFDVAKEWGLPGHEADFGETFGVWGIGEGPFVELPLLGPSNPRDASGLALGFVLDPFGFIGGASVTYAAYARGVAGGIDERAEYIEPLDDLEKNSLDFYAAMRSIYRQHREAEIREAASPQSPASEPYSVDIGTPTPKSDKPPAPDSP
jgi:phospholipid-binding lipoprotein MlaA